ncbi:protein phosphatase 1 regulatory subunit 26 isoform X2 [Xyrichtys novacula]|uniref:Protein phosphatase 1 regulatory subunit 26 isoform X2 n=1 Tax=Xyrichtys novacula TaxID=13765 RepID=A0AAV1GAK0_XYRNO|nr:protein phosphatase 1 regulatory subunit 26 isoform X2 [Xyrichtys novacula]
MYLMNVPPVAATQTEWRTCGPPGGYSLPICFNDSDSELSTRGPPISNKVQMIIESLRSTQSSLEMGDEIEGNVLSGQDGHTQVCKVPVGSYVGAKSKTKGATENLAADVISPVTHETLTDSDSDDSVDRGIEEAILEYLKEKDGHKRKAEPCFTFLQSTKVSRKTPPAPEVSKQNSDSSRFLIANHQFPTSDRTETPTVTAVIPIKKYIKHKASLDENAFKNLESHKSMPTKSFILPKEQIQSPPKTLNLFDKLNHPVTVKLEEDSNDSSSDDGIEEAIQRYQREKNEQQNKREAFNPHEFSEESDSTSDDGIEEAIRSYQLEQLKEKREVKPFLHKQKAFTKSLMHAVGSTSAENMKKRKLKKKKSRTEKEVRAAQPPPPSVLPKEGNGLLLFQMESFKEQPTPTPAPPKVNTTAELMCAEAILDISKTVMPGAFHQSVGLSSCAPSESSLQSSLPDNGREDESDGSSVDSEDGIEQEIRKFLEQKAQMHKQPPDSSTTQEPQCLNEPEEVKERQSAAQKKPLRLSLTQRRKCREENMNKTPITENKGKETSPKKEPSQRGQTHLAGLHEKEQSGDKSSSLDSDEDLDTAIKDLLKTKKKLKKKTRDMKLKSRKRLKEDESVPANTSQSKKLKQNPASKRGALKKTQKVKDDMKDKSGSGKKAVLQHKQADKSKECDAHRVETASLKATESQDTLQLNSETGFQIKEDSSSVDSDDSIEQEIRRFLAEKAKVSTAEKSKDEEVSRNGTVVVSSPPQDKDVQLENQLAEIPGTNISPLSGESPRRDQPPPTPLRDAKPSPLSSGPDISSSGVQLHMSSVLPSGSNLLEPADGAGAARTEQWQPSAGNSDVQDVTPQTERVRPLLSPSAAYSRSESIKWRQSLGLPTPDARTLSRTQFHITSSRVSETSSASAPYQSGGAIPKSQTPVTAWSSARTSRPPFSCSAETPVNMTSRPTVLNLTSLAKQHPRTPFPRGSQCPIEGETKSMVHISKDKSVFVELESNRTNHVQVRSRDRCEGKEGVDFLSERSREGESVKIDEKEVHLERREDEFIDETDGESDSRRNPEKKQGFPTLSLSSAIDPGITIRPCIALTTEERSTMFNRRYHTEKSKKGLPSLGYNPAQKKAVQYVKRKLQFIPANRENEAPSYPNKL